MTKTLLLVTAGTSAIRYYDSSAILPIYLDEAFSVAAQRALKRDFGQIVTSELTIIELRSALARLERSKKLTSFQVTTVFKTIEQVLIGTRQLGLSAEIIKETLELLSRTDLPIRALDAIHLASCLHYGTNGFVTGDKQQARLANKLGLSTQWLGGKLD